MKNLLVVCRTNSTTSLIAETLINERGLGEWTAFSAGSEPAISANAYTLTLLKESGLAGQTEIRPKSWREFEGPNAPRFDTILTVGEDVAWEDMPVWNGVPRLVHWALPDPLAHACTAAERMAMFRAVFDLVRAKVEAFLEEEARATRVRPQANDNRSERQVRFGT